MLKTYMSGLLRSPDANTEVSSSSTSTEQDDKGTTVSSTDDGASATEVKADSVTDDAKVETLEDVVNKAAGVKEDSSSSSTETADSKKAGAVQQLDTPEKAAEKEASVAAKDTKGDGELPPFHEHPRWKEVTGKLKEAEPLATEYKGIQATCSQHGIDLPELMKIAVLMNTNPSEARKALQPYVEALDRSVGTILPDDLSKKVEDGLIDADSAKEIAKLRAENQHKQTTMVRTAEAQAQYATVTALNAWEANKQSNDPDWANKMPMILDKLQVLAMQQGKPQTAEQLVALAEKAYTQVNENITKFVPAKPAKKVLSTINATTSKAKKEPESIEDVVAMVVAKHSGDN